MEHIWKLELSWKLEVATKFSVGGGGFWLILYESTWQLCSGLSGIVSIKMKQPLDTFSTGFALYWPFQRNLSENGHTT